MLLPRLCIAVATAVVLTLTPARAAGECANFQYTLTGPTGAISKTRASLPASCTPGELFAVEDGSLATCSGGSLSEIPALPNLLDTSSIDILSKVKVDTRRRLGPVELTVGPVSGDFPTVEGAIAYLVAVQDWVAESVTLVLEAGTFSRPSNTLIEVNKWPVLHSGADFNAPGITFKGQGTTTIIKATGALDHLIDVREGSGQVVVAFRDLVIDCASLGNAAVLGLESSVLLKNVEVKNPGHVGARSQSLGTTAKTVIVVEDSTFTMHADNGETALHSYGPGSELVVRDTVLDFQVPDGLHEGFGVRGMMGGSVLVDKGTKILGAEKGISANAGSEITISGWKTAPVEVKGFYLGIDADGGTITATPSYGGGFGLIMHCTTARRIANTWEYAIYPRWGGTFIGAGVHITGEECHSGVQVQAGGTGVFLAPLKLSAEFSNNVFASQSDCKMVIYRNCWEAKDVDGNAVAPGGMVTHEGVGINWSNQHRASDC